MPALIISSLAILYLAAWATLAIARPRDLGSLRVLFFAPVDPFGLIAGHVLAGLGLGVILTFTSAGMLMLVALSTNLPFPPQLLAGLLFSPIFGALAAAIGLCISASAPSSRAAMFFFGITFLVVTLIPAGYSALLSIPSSSPYYDALLFIRTGLRTLRDILQWISPFSLLSTGLDAALRASWFELFQRIAAALAGIFGWCMLAVWALRRRGVLA